MTQVVYVTGDEGTVLLFESVMSVSNKKKLISFA